MFHEGQTVTSIGDGSNGVPLGTHARILMLASADSGHLKLLSGPQAGATVFVASLSDEVAPAGKNVRQAAAQPDFLADSLEYGTLSRTGARHALATGGYGAVLQSLASAGAFAEVGSAAEDAQSYVEGQLRHSATLAEHLAELDEEDRHEVYRLASRQLLAEAFGGEYE
jgi:hypothetical protein